MLGLCKVHSEPEDILVSQKIRSILNENLCLSNYRFYHVIVHAVDGGKQTGVYNYYLEEEDMQNAGLPFESPIELWDRDKKLQSKNNRILCLKIRKLMIGVCEECFRPIRGVLKDTH